MEDFVTRLGEMGERAFDLPVCWFPSEDEMPSEPDLGGVFSADESLSTDSSKSPVASSSDADSDSTDDDEPGGGRQGRRSTRGTAGRRPTRDDTALTNDSCSDSDCTDNDEPGGGRRGRRPTRGTAGRRPTRDDNAVVEEGCFAFVIATGAHFVIGKVLAKRVSNDGESGVDLHWLRPCRDAILRRAASMSLDEHGKVAFAESYVFCETTGESRGRSKRKREKESSWEPISRVVATCTALIGKGKKIPSKVLATLRAASEAREGGKVGGVEVEAGSEMG